MNDLTLLFTFFSKLNSYQIVLIILFCLILFFVPMLVKRKYLRRVGLEIDERIENRNEWFLFPKQYNFTEKLLMILTFFGAFLLGILMLNVN